MNLLKSVNSVSSSRSWLFYGLYLKDLFMYFVCVLSTSVSQLLRTTIQMKILFIVTVNTWYPNAVCSVFFIVDNFVFDITYIMFNNCNLKVFSRPLLLNFVTFLMCVMILSKYCQKKAKKSSSESL